MNPIIGYYAATHYRITQGERELYRAGNSPFESQGYVTASEGVGLAQMREWCEQTAREFASERGAMFAGVEQEEDESDGN